MSARITAECRWTSPEMASGLCFERVKRNGAFLKSSWSSAPETAGAMEGDEP